MQRKDLLETAIDTTCGDRNTDYGDPYINLGDCADLWSAYLQGKHAGKIVDRKQFNLTSEDVAWLNVLQKIARTFNQPKPKPDTYIDAAAYAAIAGECASKEAEE